jgi:hypothetical protein
LLSCLDPQDLQFEAFGYLLGEVGLSSIEHSGTRPAIGVEAVQDEDWRASCRFWFGHDSPPRITKGAVAPQKHNRVLLPQLAEHG